MKTQQRDIQNLLYSKKRRDKEKWLAHFLRVPYCGMGVKAGCWWPAVLMTAGGSGLA
jgi:hypothetical protein